MLTSLDFLALFAFVFLANFAVRSRPKWRNALLLVAGYGFYANWSLLFFAVLMFVSALHFYLAQEIAKAEYRDEQYIHQTIGGVMAAAVIVAMAQFHRIAPFLGDYAWLTGSLVGEGGAVNPFPIGAFFFFLQSYSYLADVSRGRYVPYENLNDYHLYVSFFPRIAVGPMVSADVFRPQLTEPRGKLKPEGLGVAVFLIIAGTIKATVIAEYLSLNVVDKVFDLPTLFSTTEVIVAVYGNALALYLKLAGLTDLAVAMSLLLGFELPANFDFPYQALNLRDFWARWMMPLTAWLRDYVYAPMTGSAGAPLFRRAAATLATLLIVALAWGWKWTLVLWAVLQAVGLIVTRWAQARGQGTGIRSNTSLLSRGVRRLLVFHFVVISWTIFTVADWQTLSDMVSILPLQIWEAPNLTPMAVGLVVVALLGAWMPRNLFLKGREMFSRAPLAVHIGAIILLVFILMEAAQTGEIPFVYERL
ncbi:MAG: MBOAT family protein [Deltaproteobacteria bacterium]|nr:MBOAT family protein [Deltaproteobacteria bacterium]MCB9478969.1 MBOAT family protein [Deltaproteobacteria bacterium]MCB9487826.1 MBOAT family protein [Deltaproteobacteria bacterium]